MIEGKIELPWINALMAIENLEMTGFEGVAWRFASEKCNLAKESRNHTYFYFF